MPESRLTLPDPPARLRHAVVRGDAVAWSEPLTIRTYEAGEPSPYPRYPDGRVYQGSSGDVYPLPFVDSVANDAADRDWQAIHLENAYVRLVVLPELGGRVHIGYDKTLDYDFFYRNDVIKPALVGLGGPWISGGVELNWPQHHRPATYLPVETSIEHAEDGSVTVWCHDHDPMLRMSAHHGVRLRPDSSVVELVVRLHNRTSLRQSFLWWANVAARVDETYQSFFPQDVRYVADHARRAITAFPHADRAYYGVDYPALAAERPGADRIDFYRTIPVPTSYMIVDSQQDFFGGYDHGAGAGFVHWAERRISPGKKQWTWGNAPFGHAWDDQLTDSGGPYVELMAGVYTDNQPDFSWLLPGEVKTFSQYWYPIPAIGPAHQATPDAAVSVTHDAGSVRALVAVTTPHGRARLRISAGDRVLAERTLDLRPGEVGELAAPVSGLVAPDGVAHDGVVAADLVVPADLVVELRDAAGRVLVRWTPPAAASDGEPALAKEPPAPQDVASVEELFLIGTHLAQYRHPTWSPVPYWHEALRRDPGDVRTNLALAERRYRSGEDEPALVLVERALERLTRLDANPLDAEAFYLAGLVLTRLGRVEEAERALGKAGWDGTWSAPAGLELARLLARRGRDRAALRVLDTIDGVASHDPRRTAVRAVVLARTGHAAEAGHVLEAGLAVDPLDATLRVLAHESSIPEVVPVTEAATLLDVAGDLARLGQARDAVRVLELAIAAPVTPAGNVRPVSHYLATALLDELGDATAADRHRHLARTCDRTWAFPHGRDQHDVLRGAVAHDASDAVARHLLGMLQYASGRREEALALWEEALALGLRDPVLLRNAALAAARVAGDDALAWERLAEAVDRAPRDAFLRLGQDAPERLARLDAVRDVVLERDDLTLGYVELLTRCGRAAEALDILTNRVFHPWEGGEGRAIAAWDAARSALGLPRVDPPRTLGEARSAYPAPEPVRADGTTDYFATSLPQ